jgi:HlyD family secretion protein
VVRMPFSGALADVLVQPGEAVQAGQVLAQLKAVDVLMALAQAQTDLANAQDALQKAKAARAGLDLARGDSLTVARAKLTLAEAGAQLATAQKSYNDVSALPADNPGLLNALDALVAARQAYYRAVVDYNWYTGHASTQDFVDADARVALAKAALALAQDRLSVLQGLFGSGDQVSAELKAPISGVVLGVDAASGDPLSANAPLFTLYDPKSVEIAVTVTEEDFPYVNVGQAVQLFFDALPDAEVNGTVSRILPHRAPGDNPLYYVYIHLASVPDKLVDGMTADASIEIAGRQHVLCLPRAVVHTASGSTAAVTVWDGVRTATRQITLGLRGDTNVEILSGLKEGDQVVVK